MSSSLPFINSIWLLLTNSSRYGFLKLKFPWPSSFSAFLLTAYPQGESGWELSPSPMNIWTSLLLMTEKRLAQTSAKDPPTHTPTQIYCRTNCKFLPRFSPTLATGMKDQQWSAVNWHDRARLDAHARCSRFEVFNSLRLRLICWWNESNWSENPFKREKGARPGCRKQIMQCKKRKRGRRKDREGLQCPAVQCDDHPTTITTLTPTTTPTPNPIPNQSIIYDLVSYLIWLFSTNSLDSSQLSHSALPALLVLSATYLFLKVSLNFPLSDRFFFCGSCSAARRSLLFGGMCSLLPYSTGVLCYAFL